MVENKKLVRNVEKRFSTLLIDVFDRFEYSMDGSRFSNKTKRSLVVDLQSIRNIFVREWDILFARKWRFLYLMNEDLSFFYLKSSLFFDIFFQVFQCQ